MAKYTTQIRSIVESGTPLFDFDYPIFDPNYRNVLEKKIIDHYYFREIGLETVGQFKHFLRTKLNEIMPYYNQLYETEGLVNKENYNINLDNLITKTKKVDQTSSNENEVSGSSSATSKGSIKGNTVFSDTPQARLQGKDYATNLTELTDTNENESEGSSQEVATNTGKLNTIEEYEEHLLGNGSMRYNADILQEWRNTFINIDKMVIDELNDLFMNIY